MPLTIRFHHHPPADISKWKLVNPNEAQPQYKVYEEEISKCEKFKIILGIVIKSFFTLGTYYFIYLKCTKDGKTDLENLKMRRFVHYVPNQRPENVERVSRQGIHQLNVKGIEQHAALIERNKAHVENQDIQVDVIALTDIFKSCMQQVRDCRAICTNIKDVIQNKRAYFLEHIYEKNEALSAALEKFLNLSNEEQDSYNFIRLLAPFLKEKDLSELLKNAVESTKNAQKEKKTVHHEKFEAFQNALDNLSSKLDWLISIRENKLLLQFIGKVFQMGDHYSPSFKPLYEQHKVLYDKCLQSMEAVDEANLEMKKNIEESFLQWKKLKEELEKNLASEIAEQTHGVYYTLNEFLHHQLEEAGFDEEFQSVVDSDDSNAINVSYVELHFSGKAQEVLYKVQNLLNDKKNKVAAQRECLKKIEQAKRDQEVALEKAKAPETLAAFEKMKKCFIDSIDYNDAVYAFVEIEILFGTLHKDIANLFEFMKILKKSEFFIKADKAVCDEEFYKDFNEYFPHVDVIIAQVKSILKKN